MRLIASCYGSNVIDSLFLAKFRPSNSSGGGLLSCRESTAPRRFLSFKAYRDFPLRGNLL